MWRSPCFLLKQSVSSALRREPKPPVGLRAWWEGNVSCGCLSAGKLTSSFSSGRSGSASSDGVGGLVGGGEGEDSISVSEAKKLMRLVNVEVLKMKLGAEGKEVIGYSELVRECENMGVAKSRDEAATFARILDETGVILLYRDNVYLHPDKVVDLIRRAVPLALSPEGDLRMDELKQLQEKKKEIDMLAHKQVRRILWSGLGLAVVQIGLFFRLTFWEFSWDVMEPIAFFTTTAGIIIGYAYFLLTSRDPTYEDLMQRLFLSRQRKLIKKQNFDISKFTELQRKCKCPLDAHAFAKQRIGMEQEHEDAFH